MPGRVVLFASLVLGGSTAASWAADQNADLIARGKYIAELGDCQGCHTQIGGGTPFAGGRYMQTPFGYIPSLNLTPDKETGLGTWSDDDFYRAIHEGIRKDGKYIYPVMPYPYYTKMTRDDVMALKAYLFSLPPAHSPAKPNKLPFPLNIREALLGWRILYFKPQEFKPVEGKSAEYNRGAYIVEAMEHCSMCHTARTVLGGPSDAKWQGGQVQGWYAPNLSGDVREGLGKWSQADVVTYLKTGTAPDKGVAVGPMRETVHDSLRFLTDSDLNDIAIYLKDIPPKEQDTSARNAASKVGPHVESTAYLTYCSSCHQVDGKGIPGAVPNLAGNGAVAAAGPQNVYRAVLSGLPANNTYTRMPSFAGSLSNEDIANIANYVRVTWGNNGPQDATFEGVAKERKSAPSTLSGHDPECPAPDVAPVGYHEVLDPATGITPILKSIDPANVFEKTDQAIGIIKQKFPGIKNADIINDLYDAGCNVLAADASVPYPRKRWELDRLAAVAYVQLSPHKEKEAANMGVK